MSRDSDLDMTNAFLVSVDDKANRHPVTSVPQCRLAHDLRNSLGIVVGHCELVADTGVSERTTRHLESIRRAVLKMTTLLEECRHERCKGQLERGEGSHKNGAS